MSKKRRIFSCPECDNPYEAYPPDDLHTKVSLEQSEAQARAVGNVIKIIHDCSECKHPITLYWYRPKLTFSVG